MAQKTTLKEFEDVFPKLEEVLLEHAKSYNLPKQALDWYKRVSAAENWALWMRVGGACADKLRTSV